MTTDEQVFVVERAYVTRCRMARKARGDTTDWKPRGLSKKDYRLYVDACRSIGMNPLQAIYAATEKAIATSQSRDLPLSRVIEYAGDPVALQRRYDHKSEYSIRCAFGRLQTVNDDLEVIYGEGADLTPAVVDGQYRKSIENPVVLYGSLSSPTSEEGLDAVEAYLLCPKVYKHRCALYLDLYIRSFEIFPCGEVPT